MVLEAVWGSLDQLAPRNPLRPDQHLGIHMHPICVIPSRTVSADVRLLVYINTAGIKCARHYKAYYRKRKLSNSISVSRLRACGRGLRAYGKVVRLPLWIQAQLALRELHRVRFMALQVLCYRALGYRTMQGGCHCPSPDCALQSACCNHIIYAATKWYCNDNTPHRGTQRS